MVTGKTVPEGRRMVRVIMLNGRQVPFLVEVGIVVVS